MGKVGVLAIQGDYDAHLQALAKCGTEGIEVRTPQDLTNVDRLIIPGGESTTVGMLMARFGTGEEIKRRVAEGMPIWGTCMGMIVLAQAVEGRDQPVLGTMPITVRRNAFGAQIHSFEDEIQTTLFPTPVLGVFIRAPIVVAQSDQVETVATYQGFNVAVRYGKQLGTSFHPELTEDTRLHEWFLNL